MLCRYEDITFRAICPIHKVRDQYELTVESPQLIMVEEILEYVESLATVEETQEEITATIAQHFAGCTVTTTGNHSGVKATVTAP
jgi:hypothetical protein